VTPSGPGIELPMLPRMWLGHRQENLSPEKFAAKLRELFVPATALLMRPLGLVGYMPFLLPQDKPPAVAEEVALVVYQSLAAYQQARRSALGGIYASAHADPFSRASRSIEVRTHNAGAADNTTPYLAEVSSTADLPRWEQDEVLAFALCGDAFTGPQWKLRAGEMVNAWRSHANLPMPRALYAATSTPGDVVYGWLVLPEGHGSAWVADETGFALATQGSTWRWRSLARPVPCLGNPMELTAPLAPMDMAWGSGCQFVWPAQAA
jgi:hypothetical protein